MASKEYQREWRRKNRLAGNVRRRSGEALRKKRQRQMELRQYDSWTHKKHRAHGMVADHLRSGEMVRPDSCSKCGAVGKVQGHHADYDKPLAVEWLCLDCHIEVHRAGL